MKKIDRKQDLLYYKELFALLKKFSDPNILPKVLNAINSGNMMLPTCKCQVQRNTVGTQTSREDFEIIHCNQSDLVEDTKPIKRRNKRKHRGPRVEKSSSEKVKIFVRNDRSIKEIQTNLDNDTKKTDLANFTSSKPEVAERKNDQIKVLVDFLQDKTDTQAPQQALLLKIMKHEYKTCLVYSNNGFFPIHEAIINDDLKKLKRQLFVFKFLKYDLNDLLPKDRTENLLQFAIKSQSSCEIFEELLKTQSFLLNKPDFDNNNLLHLAVEYLEEEKDFIVFIKVMVNLINLKQHLKYYSEVNDKGETIIHTCVKSNKPFFCHLILQHVDNILESKPMEFKEYIPTNKLIEFYKTNRQTSQNLQENENLMKKKEIVNRIDLKHGSTPLHLAILNKNELLIRILLYHFADTNAKRRCGSSCLDLSDKDIQSIIAEYNLLKD